MHKRVCFYDEIKKKLKRKKDVVSCLEVYKKKEKTRNQPLQPISVKEAMCPSGEKLIHSE